MRRPRCMYNVAVSDARCIDVMRRGPSTIATTTYRRVALGREALVLRLLFVCSANVCRSPMAMAMFATRALAAELDLRVASAGTSARDDTVTDAAAIAAAADRRVGVVQRPARRLSDRAVHAADLIVTMERAHVAEVVAMVPEAFDRAFTLVELVRLGERHGAVAPGESVGEWLDRLNIGRRPVDVLRLDRSHDIADPHGGTRREYERCAARLDELVSALVDLLAGKWVTERH